MEKYNVFFLDGSTQQRISQFKLDKLPANSGQEDGYFRWMTTFQLRLQI